MELPESLKNLKIRIKDQDTLRNLQDGYKRSSREQSDVLEIMNKRASAEIQANHLSVLVEKKKQEIEELEKKIEAQGKIFKELSEEMVDAQKGMNTVMMDFLEDLTASVVRSLDPESVEEINSLIESAGAFKGKDIHHFVRTNLQEDFDIDFLTGEVIITNPSPMLLQVLIPEAYTEFRANKKEAEEVTPPPLEPKKE